MGDCDVCAGGLLPPKKPCICDGTGRMSEAIKNLRLENLKLEEQNDQYRRTLERIVNYKAVYVDHGDTSVRYDDPEQEMRQIAREALKNG